MIGRYELHSDFASFGMVIKMILIFYFGIDALSKSCDKLYFLFSIIGGLSYKFIWDDSFSFRDIKYFQGCKGIKIQ